MGNSLPKAAQDAAGLLYHNNALPAHGQLLVHQDQGLLCRTAFWPVGPQPVLVQGLIPRCRTLHFPVLNFMRFLSVQPVKVPLCGSTTFWLISHSTEFFYHLQTC